jgi:hypothetical protein
MSEKCHKRPVKNSVGEAGLLSRYKQFARDRATRRARWRSILYGRYPINRSQRPWNKGLLIGQKKPLEPKHVWSIRVRLEIARSRRDLAICGVGQRSCKRRQDGRSSLRSRNSPEIPSKRGYHCSGPRALDTSSQADFMPAPTYQPANMRGWCIDGSRASAWSQPLIVRTRCGVRRLPRFIERP